MTDLEIEILAEKLERKLCIKIDDDLREQIRAESIECGNRMARTFFQRLSDLFHEMRKELL